jgi:DNA-binding LacI/PurR family transcriptional regulator
VVLCLIPDLTVSQATEEFKVELSRVLGDAGYGCVYLHHAGARQSLEDLWQHVHPAVVVAFGQLDPADAEAVHNAGIGLVDGIFGADSATLIGVDQQELGRMQVRYLAERGHRQIGYAAVADPREEPFCVPRQRGAQHMCRELGLPEPVVAVLDDTPASAGHALTEWRQAGVTAVAAYNDLTALAVISVSQAAGLSIPSDLAVIGVDDLRVAALVTPRLTTIRMDLTLAARLLAGHVIALVNPAGTAGGGVEANDQVFELIQRQSA